MHSRRIKNNWHIIKGQPLTELDKKVLYYQNKGHLVPSRKLIKTAEQIEGIRRSSVDEYRGARFGLQERSRPVCLLPRSISWYMIIPFRTGLFRRL